MTKINIISGFLGAGKTTLIKKLISDAFKGEKVVLIENEFGEIGIDGGFLKDSGIEITEMNSGCICCTLVGDFSRSLSEVLEKYSPERVIIEPSGVGKLSDVINAVKEVKSDKELEIRCFTTVADVTKYHMYEKAFGEFFNNQIEYATTVILSRTQKASQEKIENVIKSIRGLNEKAVIITTPWDEIGGDTILKAIERTENLEEELMHETECCCHHDHEHHHHDGECCHHDHEHHHHDGECCHHDHEHHHHDGECCHHEHEHHHNDGECCHHDHEHHHNDGECCCHDHEHHHHHADEAFTSWGIETPKKFTEDEINTALKALADGDKYGTILRAKGILPSVEGEWIYFDFVPEEFEIRRGNPDYTGKLCVIGADINKENLAELFGI